MHQNAVLCGNGLMFVGFLLVNGLLFLTRPYRAWTTLQVRALENIMAYRENEGNQHFLPFQHYLPFQLFPKQTLVFMCHQ